MQQAPRSQELLRLPVFFFLFFFLSFFFFFFFLFFFSFDVCLFSPLLPPKSEVEPPRDLSPAGRETVPSVYPDLPSLFHGDPRIPVLKRSSFSVGSSVGPVLNLYLTSVFDLLVGIIRRSSMQSGSGGLDSAFVPPLPEIRCLGGLLSPSYARTRQLSSPRFPFLFLFSYGKLLWFLACAHPRDTLEDAYSSRTPHRSRVRVDPIPRSTLFPTPRRYVYWSSSYGTSPLHSPWPLFSTRQVVIHKIFHEGNRGLRF